MVDYSNQITDKFVCSNCGKNNMYPNVCGNKIKGFVCAGCGAVNYPVRETLKKGDKLYV